MSFTELTPEEIQEVFERTFEAIAVIKHREKGTKRPNGGFIECPKCGKRLSYTIASNNHVHGCCETADCLRWME